MTDPEYKSTLEGIWRKLRPHLEWAEGFTLAVLFTRHPAPVTKLRKRLREVLSVGTLPLRAYELTDPSQVDDLLTTILSSRPLGGKHPPIWLDMWEKRGNEGQRQDLNNAVWRLLSRLNERRFLLERDVACPVVLVLSAEFRPDVPSMIPDLWSVRSFTADLPTPAVVTGARGTEPVAVPPALIKSEPAWAEREWQRLWETTRDKKRLAPEAGFAAIDAALKKMDFEAARLLVNQVLEAITAREQVSGVLRQLSIALDFKGDVEMAFGTPTAARVAYDESLEICRRLIAVTGENPQALRDLSVSLERVGDVDRALNRFEEARTAYAESLEIRRRLLAVTGETPQTLRDLSVSLDNVGDVDRALNRFEEARAVFAESLEICRRLISAIGETPQALRDLSISLDRIGAWTAP